MAEKRAAEGEPGAAELVRQAGDEAGLALKDLRDLARGIHPAILTNRGLPAALHDLAGRAPVPVEVVAAPTERLPDQVEAAAYFVVSECLANVDKHAQATRATVSVEPQDGQLIVAVSDDGVGGAAARRRVGAAGARRPRRGAGGDDRRGEHAGGGDHDPRGHPARAGRRPAEPRRDPEPAAAERRGREQLQARRVQGLRARSAVLGGIALVVVAVWALTGAPNRWVVWPLLGIWAGGGAAGAGSCWAARRARLSDLAEHPDVRAFQRRRGLRADARGSSRSSTSSWSGSGWPPAAATSGRSG